MVARKGLLAPQNTFLDTIAARFDGTHSNFVLGNAKVPPAHPIVYCSDGFCDLSGFPRAHIMQKGCACKFLYGPGTDEEKKEELEKALEAKDELQMEVQLYKKNGNPFWCLVDLVPIKNERHEVVLFLVSHKDITSSRLFVPGVSRLSNGSSSDCELPPTFNANRRRSRAVLYGIQDHYKANPRKSKLKKYQNKGLLNTSTVVQPLPEYKTAAAKKPRWVLSHYGYFKNLWDLAILLATVYVAITVPYRAAFNDNTTSTCSEPVSLPFVPSTTNNTNIAKTLKPSVSNFHISDVVVEIIFFIDILLNFRTTFVNEKGEVVSNTREIAVNYFRTWFFLDLIAALPFDVLHAFSDLMGTYESRISLLKLTRLLRLARLVGRVDRYSQYSGLILTLLMGTFILLSHWLACIWFAIADMERDLEGAPNSRSWLVLLQQQQQLGHQNVTCVMDSDAYITALYFTCTSLTTVGFGNVAANTKYEKIFSIVIMMVGALMHATIFGHVTNQLQRMYSRKQEYNSKWGDLKEFTTVHAVPKALKQKMQDYFQTVWSINHGIDPSQVLADYPEELRGDVSMHLHKEVLSLPLFETASQGCQKSISLKIKTTFCAPDEFLVHKGDVLHSIFYLSNGSMEVLQDGMVVAILGKGDLVGCDISRFTSNGEGAVVKSSSDVRALTYCDLEVLHIPGLTEVLRLHPDFLEQFSEDIQHDLTYNLREGYDPEEKEVSRVESSATILPCISEESDTSPGSQGSSEGFPCKAEDSLANLEREMRSMLEMISKERKGGPSLSTRDRGGREVEKRTVSVQTDFPAQLLESYVVKHKARVLSLLASPRSSSTSLNRSPPLPPATLVTPPVEEQHGVGKRYSCGDLGDQDCLMPLLATNGAAVSCSLLSERRKTAVTDF